MLWQQATSKNESVLYTSPVPCTDYKTPLPLPCTFWVAVVAALEISNVSICGAWNFDTEGLY